MSNYFDHSEPSTEVLDSDRILNVVFPPDDDKSEVRLLIGNPKAVKNPNRRWWQLWKPRIVVRQFIEVNQYDIKETWTKDNVMPIEFTLDVTWEDKLIGSYDTEIDYE